ncbi:MAG: hypothetical protein AAGC81_01145 [Pseudomonadota bacterium]
MAYSRLKSTAAIAVVFCLAGCQGVEQSLDQAGAQFGSLFSDEYLADKQDVCFRQRETLAQEGQFWDPDVVQATLLGAGAGALTALVTGENVLVGAAIGGGLGLATGYLAKLQSEGLSGNEITSTARTDIDTANKNIDALLVAFDNLSACRRDEARAVQLRLNAKTTTREQAEAEMAGVRERFREDRLKFEELAMQIADNSNSYTAIYNDIAADNETGALEVKEYKRGKKSATVKKAPPKKTAGTEEGSLKADKQEVEALQRDLLTNVQKRDETFEKVAAAEEAEEEFELA